MNIKRNLALYIQYSAQYIKSQMEYRFDYFCGLFGFFLLQTCGVIFITLVFNVIPALEGWTFYEILFIYGFAQLSRGLDHMFSDNLWLMGSWLIQEGAFDRVLLRPINPLFQVIMERFQTDGFGEFLIGIILMVLASLQINLEWTLLKVLVLILCVIAGAFIITSIKLITCSIAFWTKRSGPFMQVTYEFNQFCYYPVTIYSKGLQFFLTFIIPFALTSYYPATWILGRQNAIWGIAIPCVISVIFSCVSYSVWKLGISHYESAGN